MRTRFGLSWFVSIQINKKIVCFHVRHGNRSRAIEKTDFLPAEEHFNNGEVSLAATKQRVMDHLKECETPNERIDKDLNVFQ